MKERFIAKCEVRSAIKKNTETIPDYQNRILELDKKLEGKNELLSSAYQDQVKLTVWTLVWITILLELFFEACIAYIRYYYYRSYVERNNVSSPFFENKYESTPPSEISDTSESPNPEQFFEIQKELSTIRVCFVIKFR